MTTLAVTGRWADALFASSQRQNAVDEVLRDCEQLSAEVARPMVADFMFGGGIAESERRKKIGPLLETLHPLTRNFVSLLFDNRRQEVLKGIGAAMKERVLESKNAVEGTLESARELDSDNVNKVAEAIGRRLGKTVHLTQTVDPELIAGVRVLVGARMFDFSARGRLEGLRQRLLDAPLQTQTA